MMTMIANESHTTNPILFHDSLNNLIKKINIKKDTTYCAADLRNSMVIVSMLQVIRYSKLIEMIPHLIIAVLVAFLKNNLKTEKYKRTA